MQGPKFPQLAETGDCLSTLKGPTKVQAQTVRLGDRQQRQRKASVVGGSIVSKNVRAAAGLDEMLYAKGPVIKF